MRKKAQQKILKALMLLVISCLITIMTRAQSAGDAYVEKHKKTAVILMKKSGIPASIILGVSMIESAMGKSKNCKLLNNYFGVKGKNNLAKGKSGHHSAYKQYPSANASFKDFVRIIQTKKYYTQMKDNMDYKLWLVKMNQHGYATAKGKWIHDIQLVIKKYHLADFDKKENGFEDDSYPVWGVDSTLMQLQD